MTVLLFLVLLVVSGGCQTLAADNLLRNGNFSSGDLSGWSLVPTPDCGNFVQLKERGGCGPSDCSGTTYCPGEPPEGKLVFWCGSGRNATVLSLSQVFPCLPGAFYNVSYYLALEGAVKSSLDPPQVNDTGCRMDVTVDSKIPVGLNGVQLDGIIDWTSFSRVFACSSGSAKLTFSYSCDQYFFLSSVKAVRVSAPMPAPSPAAPTPTSPTGPASPPPLAPPPKSPPSGGSKTRLATGIIAAVVCAVVLMAVVAWFLVCLCLRRRKDRGEASDISKLLVVQTVQSFPYQVLFRATQGFSPTAVIGEGGFGPVYRGTLPEGTVVAVKELSKGSKQGEKEFLSEVHVLGRLHHKNLVELLGYCVTGSRRLLVYELMPNGSLQGALFKVDNPVKLTWAQAVAALLAIARGLMYLHKECEQRIVHRDIKPANILLDDNFVARLADFGLARKVDPTATEVETRIGGTLGYLAPEVGVTCEGPTTRSDVYSFGILMLVVLSGRRPLPSPGDAVTYDYHGMSPFLVHLAALALAKQQLQEVFLGSHLEGERDLEELERLVNVAVLCTQRDPRTRPGIDEVVAMMTGVAPVPPLPLSGPDSVVVGGDEVPTSWFNSSDNSSLLSSTGKDTQTSSQV